MAKTNMPEQEREALLADIEGATTALLRIDSELPAIGGNRRDLDSARHRIGKVIESMETLKERLEARPTKTDIKAMLKTATPEQIEEVARILTTTTADAPAGSHASCEARGECEQE